MISSRGQKSRARYKNIPIKSIFFQCSPKDYWAAWARISFLAIQQVKDAILRCTTNFNLVTILRLDYQHLRTEMQPLTSLCNGFGLPSAWPQGYKHVILYTGSFAFFALESLFFHLCGMSYGKY